MLAFYLSMPGCPSWDGKWSGDGKFYAKVVSKRTKEKELDGKSFTYRWSDGWCARVDVRKVDAQTARKIRKKSQGFCGYDWMITSIIENGEILV